LAKKQKIPTPESVKKKYPVLAWIFIGLASLWTLIQVIESSTVQSMFHSIYTDYKLILSPIELKYVPGFANIKYSLKNVGEGPILVSKHVVITNYGDTLSNKLYPLKDNFLIVQSDAMLINEQVPVIYWHPYNTNDSTFLKIKNDNLPVSTLYISIELLITIGSKKYSKTIQYGRILFYSDETGKESLDASSNIVIYD
jgi:hypothetical protein